MPKRKRNTPTVNVVVNISESILNFMKPQPVEERVVMSNKPATPDSLFPINEVAVWAEGAHGPYIAAESKRNGTLMGKCRNCTREKKSIEAFAPPENLKNCRKRPAFLAALDAYETAYAARDPETARTARDEVVELRVGFCPPCQEVNKKLSPREAACKAWWEAERKKAGRCATPGCCENGPDAWQVLQANHLDPKGLQDPANKKVHILGDYKWWAKGEWTVDQCVAEMRKEAAKCNFLCGFCHALDKHSTSANRSGDPAAMPPGKQGKTATKEEVAQYMARHHANICFPKKQFVDAEKLRRGCCSNPACRRLVTAETCPAFPFDHRVEATKMKGKDTLAGDNPGGVGGLVNNLTKAAALDVVYDSNGNITYDDQGVICVRDNEFKVILVEEEDKCRLLCENCHHRKTWYGLVINEEDEATL
jgi:hypothetical protein